MLLLSACAGEVTDLDAGTTSDAGNTNDAGVVSDAGTVPDAGTAPDAGTTTDAGTRPDAGNTNDAGVVSDAGSTTDAGTRPDGGSAADAGAASSLPTPATTGWAHTGATLQACEQYVSGGSYVLNGTGTPLTVDSCDFHDRQVRISGNVTLKRSRVINNSTCDSACAAIIILSGAGPVLIEDLEIDTTDHNAVGGGARQDRTITVAKNNTLPVVIRRLYAHDTSRGIDLTTQNNVTIEDSYHGPNVSPPIGQRPGVGCPGSERPHASAIRAAGSTYNIVIRNTVLHIGACSFASGLIATYTENGSGPTFANHDWEIAGGLWVHERDNPSADNTGGYGIAAGCDWYGSGSNATKYQNYNFNIHDVKISTQHNSDGCPAGCAQGWNNMAGTAIWANVTKYRPGHADDGDPISAALPQGGASAICPRANQ
jgi:hypothetical protein